MLSRATQQVLSACEARSDQLRVSMSKSLTTQQNQPNEVHELAAKGFSLQVSMRRNQISLFCVIITCFGVEQDVNGSIRCSHKP